MNTRQQKPFRILLIGDACIDVYQYGSVTRLSPEAPVPIFETRAQYPVAGMAGNVKTNLENLGCKVTGVFGTGKLSQKIRYIDDHSNQHIIRIDSDVKAAPLTPLSLPSKWESKFDAVVVSDYDKGAVTAELIEHVRQSCDLPIFVDTKIRDVRRFEGCYVKINEIEYSKLVSTCSDMIVTMGSKGARYKDVVYPVPQLQITDVCGAGDTFLSALAYQFVNSNDIVESIKFANKASSITVQHMGVYAPTLSEIREV